MDVDTPEADLARLYGETRERLTTLVAGLDEAQLAAPVPACPGWSVADVIGHLAAIPEDALAGRLTGPPSEAETAVQVARFRGRLMAQTLAGWTEQAPRFEEIVAAFEVWPAVIDVASHEQDIRGAVGQPGARDTEVIKQMSGWLIARLRPPVPVPAAVLDHLVIFGPATADIIE